MRVRVVRVGRGGRGLGGRVRVGGRRGLHQRHLALELVEHRQHALAPLHVEGAEGRAEGGRGRRRSGSGRDARDEVGAGIDRRAGRRRGARAERGKRGRVASGGLTRAPCRRRFATRRRPLLSASRRTATAGARAPIWHVPGPNPGASPPPSRFGNARVPDQTARHTIRGPTITNRHGRQQRATTTDRGRERATRESRARAARDEPRGAPTRIARRASRLVRGRRFAGRGGRSRRGRSRRDLSSVVAHKRSRGDAMPPTPGSAPRAVDHPDPRDETRDETFTETTPSSARRSRSIQPPADADVDADGPMGRRGATTARVSRARPTTNRRPILRGGRRRPGDPRPARLRAHLPLNPNPKPQTSPPRTSPR